MDENFSHDDNIEAEFLPTETRYKPTSFALLSLLIVFVLYQFIGGGLAVTIAGIQNPNIMILRGATMAAQCIFLLLPTLWLLKRQHGRYHTALPFRTPNVKEFILAIVALFALLQILDGYMYFQEMIPVPHSLQKIVEQLQAMIEESYRQLVVAHSPLELFFVLAVVSITPAICEEILFRGLVQYNFSLSTTGVKSFLLTGIIFGVYHINPFQVVPLIGIGIFLSFLRFRSRTLILPMTVHFINNAFSVMGVYFLGYDEAATSISLRVPETMGTVFSRIIFFGIIFTVTLWYYYKSTDESHEQNEHS